MNKTEAIKYIKIKQPIEENICILFFFNPSGLMFMGIFCSFLQNVFTAVFVCNCKEPGREEVASGRYH